MSLGEIAFLLAQPSNAIVIVMAVGAMLLWLRRTAGPMVLAASGLMLVVLGLTPLGPLLLSPLEQRFPFEGIMEPPAGIIVLGGFLEVRSSLAHKQIQLNERAERITAAAALAQRFPEADVIVSDGGPPAKSGADLAKVLLRDFGIARERIVMEANARSTWDNARYTYDVVQPERGRRYVLVTSAAHMPRAIGTFRKAGWPPLVPWPVDYLAEPSPWRDFPGSVGRGLRLMDEAAREYAALALYFFSGRTDALLPAPMRTGPRADTASTGSPR